MHLHINLFMTYVYLYSIILNSYTFSKPLKVAMMMIIVTSCKGTKQRKGNEQDDDTYNLSIVLN